MPKPTVIVVNSLVARGSVGGRAGVFALERLGFPVIFVPTVVLAWHPGHGPATRMVPDAAAFAALIDDLVGSNRLGDVGAVLTGYFGAAGEVADAARLVTALKAVHPAARYLCDPNIGDTGGLFQPEAIARTIRDRLLPLADIATPNRFESDWLNAGGDDARPARPPELVVTSAAADAGTIETWVATPAARLRVSHRWLPGNTVHGTGDLFAALYLGHRLDGATPGEAAALASGAVCHMVEAARRDGLDELPLAACQEAIGAPAAGVTVTAMADD